MIIKPMYALYNTQLISGFMLLNRNFKDFNLCRYIVYTQQHELSDIVVKLDD